MHPGTKPRPIEKPEQNILPIEFLFATAIAIGKKGKTACDHYLSTRGHVMQRIKSTRQLPRRQEGLHIGGWGMSIFPLVYQYNAS
jgi:hypothetical protein